MIMERLVSLLCSLLGNKMSSIVMKTMVSLKIGPACFRAQAKRKLRKKRH